MDKIKLLSPYVLTADIGGSHITSAVCNIGTNTIIPQSVVRIELSSKGLAKDILGAWESAFNQSLAKAGMPVYALAAAMPGPFDYERGICYIKGLNKYEALYEMDIKQYLAGLLKLNPALVRFRNDAEATIAGEVLAGAGKGCRKVMGITLGTGFGSALFENTVTGDLNLGSSPYKNSIADDHLSTRWFLKRYHELSGISVTGVKDLALMADDSKTVRQIFKEFADNMAGFLSVPIARLTPQVLIICGNISKASAYFLPQVKKQLHSTDIRLGQLGENAALIGAAGLFKSFEISPSDTQQTITTNI